jgi:hypothetical protein
MKKKLYLGISILSLLSLLTGISYLIEGIGERGITGVNYGRAGFPLLFCVVFFLMFRKQDK